MFKELAEEYWGADGFARIKRKVRKTTMKELREPATMQKMVDHFLIATQVTETNTYLMTQMTSQEYVSYFFFLFEDFD